MAQKLRRCKQRIGEDYLLFSVTYIFLSCYVIIRQAHNHFLLADAGIQRPLVFFDLFHYPANEASAVTDSVWFPRTLSVRLVGRFSTPCRVSGLPALAALSGRCAAL